jgi:hypothetical protein
MLVIFNMPHMPPCFNYYLSLLPENPSLPLRASKNFKVKVKTHFKTLKTLNYSSLL